MDIITNGIPNAAGGVVRFVSVLTAPADELQALVAAIEQALHGGPAVFEARASNGIPFRILIDRLGDKLPTQ